MGLDDERPIYAEFSALDECECDLARKLDGTIWPFDAPERVAHEPPLKDCPLGAGKCSCVMLYYWRTDKPEPNL